jgi:hypothetical protein
MEAGSCSPGVRSKYPLGSDPNVGFEGMSLAQRILNVCNGFFGQYRPLFSPE